MVNELEPEQDDLLKRIGAAYRQVREPISVASTLGVPT